jgi:hypothetical protein
MANTPTTPQALISGVSAFNPIADSDMVRWAIIQLNNMTAGGVANNAPTTQQIETAATQLEMLQSPKLLQAILLQLLIGIIGGSSSTARVLTDTVAPNGNVFAPPGTLYTQVIAPGFGTIFLKTSAATLNTGWI